MSAPAQDGQYEHDDPDAVTDQVAAGGEAGEYSTGSSHIGRDSQ